MVDTLTNIQTDARFYANDSALTITSGDGLRIFNLVYQGMFSPGFIMRDVKVGRRWPEATREDTSLTMVAGQEDYTWPTTPKFKHPIWLEGTEGTARTYPIIWVPDMTVWSAYGPNNVGDTEPIYARLLDVSGTLTLSLRPNPNRADGIRINGLIEITELTQGADSTVFVNVNSDRALSKLVAAEFKAKRGDGGRADELIAEAVGLLPEMDATPVLTGSGRIIPWGDMGHHHGFSHRRSRFGR